MEKKRPTFMCAFGLIVATGLAGCEQPPAPEGDAPDPATSADTRPVMLDGVEHPPGFLATWTGPPLHQVADREAREKGFLRVFTTFDKSRAFTASLPPAQPPELPPDTLALGTDYYTLFDLPNFGGWQHDFYRTHTIPDMNCAWWDFFGCHNLNDQVGSVMNLTPRHLVFHHGVLYTEEGTLTVLPWDNVSFDATWNNKASSMFVY
jgi:hypothetical protein